MLKIWVFIATEYLNTWGIIVGNVQAEFRFAGEFPSQVDCPNL